MFCYLVAWEEHDATTAWSWAYGDEARDELINDLIEKDVCTSDDIHVFDANHELEY